MKINFVKCGIVFAFGITIGELVTYTNIPSWLMVILLANVFATGMYSAMELLGYFIKKKGFIRINGTKYQLRSEQ